ncbi:MAG: hypothetical protein ACK5VL_06205 [Brevundimonas sp.]
MMRTQGACLRAILPGAAALGLVLGLGACGTTGSGGERAGGDSAPAEREPLARGLDAAANPDPYPSTYRPLPAEDVAIVGATVFTATGQRIESGVVVLTGGRIAAVGGA